MNKLRSRLSRYDLPQWGSGSHMTHVDQLRQARELIFQRFSSIPLAPLTGRLRGVRYARRLVGQSIRLSIPYTQPLRSILKRVGRRLVHSDAIYYLVATVVGVAAFLTQFYFISHMKG